MTDPTNDLDRDYDDLAWAPLAGSPGRHEATYRGIAMSVHENADGSWTYMVTKPGTRTTEGAAQNKVGAMFTAECQALGLAG